MSRFKPDGKVVDSSGFPPGMAIFEEPVNFIAVGNPGAGKSTLLNGLAGSVAFPAGISVGGGKTSVLKEFVMAPGYSLWDTPGLNDPLIREEAAAEIAKGLRKGGKYKILFFLTTESGRANTADVATMKTVLDAAPEIGSNYGIVLNKVTRPLMKVLNDPRELVKFMTCTNGTLENPTEHFMVNPRDEALDDEEDVVKKPIKPMLEFIRNIPAVEITPECVEDLKTNNFEGMMKMVAYLQTKLEEAMQDNKELQKQIASLEHDVHVNKELREKVEILRSDVQFEKNAGLFDWVPVLGPVAKQCARWFRR